jgi:hypothetical protein
VSHQPGRPEALKLARLLHADPEELSYLFPLPSEDVRAYRESVIELLYDDDRELMHRAADAARLMPAHTLAKIGEHALGPLICARLSGLVDPRKAGDIAEHFSVDFLAQLCAELDPRHAADVVASVRPDKIVAAAQVMAERGESVAMGRFVGFLHDDTLARCMDVLDDLALLRIAYVIESDDSLPTVCDRLGAERVERMVSAGKAEGLLDEAAQLRERAEIVQLF